MAMTDALFVEPMNEAELTAQRQLETARADDWQARLRLIFKLEEETLRRCGIAPPPVAPPRRHWRP